MTMPDLNMHSFVVRIWLEEPVCDGKGARWRGHVTHVPSEEKRYIERLIDLDTFIGSYLKTMGVSTEYAYENGAGPDRL